MSTTIDTLQIEIIGSSNSAASSLDILTAALERLKTSARGGAGLTAANNQLKKLSTTISGLNTSNMTKFAEQIRGVSDAMKPLGEISKGGLTSALNSLKKLPDVSSSLEKLDMSKFAKQMRDVSNAVQPLANNMHKVSSGFSSFPAKIQKATSSFGGYAKATARAVVSNKQFGGSFGGIFTGITGVVAKIGVWTMAAKRIAGTIGGWVTESNDYVENVNLFTVALGKYAGEAQKYAEAVRDAVGIDPSDWMRNQGIFKQIASGFGIVEEKAYTMSKGLTQIGYDRILSLCGVICIEKQGEPVYAGCAA